MALNTEKYKDFALQIFMASGILRNSEMALMLPILTASLLPFLFCFVSFFLYTETPQLLAELVLIFL